MGMLVPLERRVAARLDLEVAGDEAERLFAGGFPQKRLTGDVPVRHVSSLVLAHGNPVPAKPAELEDLRSIIHGIVVSPPRPPVLQPRSGRAARKGSRRSRRSCPRRSARASAVPALRRSRLPAPETPVPPARAAPATVR